MIGWPICTRATVPCGLPKAPRIPVWSLFWWKWKRKRTQKTIRNDCATLLWLWKKKTNETLSMHWNWILNQSKNVKVMFVIIEFITQCSRQIIIRIPIQFHRGETAEAVSKIEKNRTKHTYQLRHMTTSCWSEWRGMDERAYECGIDLCRSAWPSICWRRYVQLPKLRSSTVRIHRTPSGHIVESLRRWPSFCPNRKYGSLDLAHLDRNVILDTAYFCNSGSWNKIITSI